MKAKGIFNAAKWYLAGVATMMAISSVVVVAAPQTLQAIFGVRVSLDGQVLDFEADSQPFIVDGRTFLPLRAIADTLNLGVAFDGENNMAVLTSPGSTSGTPVAPQPEPAPVPEPTPAPEPEPEPQPEPTPAAAMPLMDLDNSRITWDGITLGGHLGNNGHIFSIGDRSFPNSLHNVLSSGGTGNRPNQFHFALYGEFTELTGYVGAINDAFVGNSANPEAVARVRFYGDGHLLGEYTFSYDDAAIAVAFDVTDVQHLTVSFTNNINRGGNIRPTFANPWVR